MFNKIIKESEFSMKKCINLFNNNINKIRTDRVSSGLLNDIKLEYYGKQIYLYELCSVKIKNLNKLIVTVYDHSLISLVNKAILSSNLGLNPYIVNTLIYVPIPSLTSERRSNLIKVVRLEAENTRILIRNIRRHANSKVKNFLKKKIITNDNEYDLNKEIQKLTDVSIEKINKILLNKELELIKF
ncbi:MAG: ribosome recycling factor [gamma proteobacterium endosymbiont of Trioza apicalis]